MKRIQKTIVCLGAVALLLGGCGGSGDSTEPTLTTSSLSKAKYIEQGDQICKEGFRDLKKAIRSMAKIPAESTAEKEQLLADKALPPYQQMADGLRSLGAPAHDEAKVQAILDSYDREIEAVRADPSTAYNGGVVFAEAQKLAFEYGLKACEF
jgi:hypothetical protein